MNERVAGLLFKIRADTTSLREGMKSATTAVGGLEGAVRGIGGSLLKFAITTGAALMTFQTVVNVLKSTEGSSDKLNEAISILKGSFQGLARTIVTGDWVGLISNMVKAAKAARDLEIAQDNLADSEASNEIRKSKLQRYISSARLAATETTDPVQKKKYLEEAIDYQKQLTEITKNELYKRIQVTEQSFNQMSTGAETYSQKTIEAFRAIATNYDKYFGAGSEERKVIDDAITKYEYLVNTLKQKPTVEQYEVYRGYKLAAFYLDEFKKIHDGLAPGKFQEYASQITEFNSAISQGTDELRTLQKTLTATENKIGESFANQPVPGKITPIGTTLIPNIPPESINQLKESLDQVKEIYIDFSDEIKGIFLEVADIIGNAIEGAFEGMSAKEIGKEALKSMGKFMQKMGAMILAYGIAMVAFKKAFLNPVLAIIAGAALLAIGSAISGLAGRGVSGGGGGGGTAMIRGGGGGGYNSGTLKVQTESVTKGSDIYQVSKRYGNYRASTT